MKQISIYFSLLLLLSACSSRNIDKRKTHKFIKLQKRFVKLTKHLRTQNKNLYKKNYHEIALIQDVDKITTLKTQLGFLSEETRNILLKIEQLKTYLKQKYGGQKDTITLIENFALNNEVAYEMIENKKGYVLENQLNEYVEFLNLQFLDLYEIERFLLLTDAKKSFVKENFGAMTLIGTLSILSQKQVAILQYEQRVLKKILADMHQKPSSEKLLLWANSLEKDTLTLGETYELSVESFYQSSLQNTLLILEEDSTSILSEKAKFEIIKTDTAPTQGQIIIKGTKYNFEIK